MTSDFWPVAADPEACHRPRYGDFQPRDQKVFSALLLCGLAVTEDHYLVVGTREPKGLLIFDLHGGGEPRQLLWPEQAPFAPFDMAPRPCGGVWILDRKNRSYWALDRNFNVIGPKGQDGQLAEERPDDFQPLTKSATRGQAQRSFAGSFPLVQSPLSVIDPISIEALPDGSVLILDYDPS